MANINCRLSHTYPSHLPPSSPPPLYHSAVAFKKLIRRTLLRQPRHSKEHPSRRGADVRVPRCVCECVFVQIFYSTVWPGRKTDLLTIIMGQSEPFRWCRWSLCTSSRLHYSVFSSAPSHPSLSTSDHPLSVLPPLCFVTSSRANHRFIKTGGEIEKTRKGRGIERDAAGSAD